MLEIERFSKEMVHDIMRELLYSLNYSWFEIEEWLKKTYPGAAESEGFQRLYERFGSFEARRLSKFVDRTAKGIDALIASVKLSHWQAFENIDIEKLSEADFKMRTIDCSAQKAAKRWGMPYYSCGQTGRLVRSGFYRELNPMAKVETVFTPPDTPPEGMPDGVSCEWHIFIEE
jgi:hypothetical protein